MKLTRRGRTALGVLVVLALAAGAYAVSRIVHYAGTLTVPDLLAAFDGRALLLVLALVVCSRRIYRAGRARQRIAHSFSVFLGHPR